MDLASTAFENGQTLPRTYVHGGDNQSPPLHWWDAPERTRSFMVVCEDPDAPKGTFRHWAYFDIPDTYEALPEGAGRVGQPTGRQAVNDFGYPRYDGPEPPIGHGPHRYVFRLYALDVSRLEAAPHSATVLEAIEAARPHILAEAEITGVYERRG
jgi:Raf kinase inhibitor-like YbhB/YbcL family protein